MNHSKILTQPKLILCHCFLFCHFFWGLLLNKLHIFLRVELPDVLLTGSLRGDDPHLVQESVRGDEGVGEASLSRKVPMRCLQGVACKGCFYI